MPFNSGRKISNDSKGNYFLIQVLSGFVIMRIHPSLTTLSRFLKNTTWRTNTWIQTKLPGGSHKSIPGIYITRILMRMADTSKQESRYNLFVKPLYEKAVNTFNR